MWKSSWLVLMLGFSYQGGSQLAVHSASTVCWLETSKLTWADFQAVTKPTLAKEDILPSSFLGATTEANVIVYDQLTSTGQYISSIVNMRFDRSKSWVNKTADFDRKGALAHEQLHFDAVELTGRKIRQVLARCATRHISYHTPEIEAEIGCLYDEEYDLQLLYDKEAGNASNPRAQAWWQAYVHRELARLRAFKSTAKDCPAP